MTENVQPTPEAEEEDRQGNPLSLATEAQPANGFRWSLKRRKFVIAYVRTNGESGKAALEAGYSYPGEGSYLLSLPQIQSAIQTYLRAHLTAAQVTEESVIERWHRWADCSPADFFEYEEIPVQIADGNQIVINRLRLKNLDNLSDHQRKSLKKITVRDTQHGQDIQIEVQDQAKANDRLAQILGMLNTDTQLANVPPPEEAARMIHEFLQLADEADGLDGGHGEPADRSEAGSTTDPSVDSPNQPTRAA